MKPFEIESENHNMIFNSIIGSNTEEIEDDDDGVDQKSEDYKDYINTEVRSLNN